MKRAEAIPEAVVKAAIDGYDSEEAEQNFRGYRSRELKFRHAIIAALDAGENKYSSDERSRVGYRLHSLMEEASALRERIGDLFQEVVDEGKQP